jgi:predicted O-linked N-acetylglucosamine transferase (SPINDLY family)
MQNLVRHAQFHGVPTRSRVYFLSLLVWYGHIQHKTGLDLFLDTVKKNGHTTTVDYAWAGVPTVALGGQPSASRRSAQSIMHHLAPHVAEQLGVVFSLKEYEDLVVALATTRRGRGRLRAWQQYARSVRPRSGLFDAQHFADVFLRSVEAMRDLLHHHRDVNNISSSPSYHLFYPK